MDIKTLESLGLTSKILGDRIVEQAVEALLTGVGFDPDTEEEIRYETQFKREIEKQIQKTIDEKIAALAAVHLVPRIGELIEKIDMRKTNNYGEAISPSMTFKEYLAHRAETYMTEDVDAYGNSKTDLEIKNKSSYDWRSCGSRLTILMKIYIRDSMEKVAKAAVTDINTVIAKNMEKAAKDAIASVVNTLKVGISV